MNKIKDIEYLTKKKSNKTIIREMQIYFTF